VTSTPLDAGTRHPAVPGHVPDLNIEAEHIEKGQATMPKASSRTSGERAAGDIEIDLGNGYSVTYRDGDVVAPQHRDLPTRAASLPKSMTTQDEDREPGDLAPDRLADTSDSGIIG
jgi:hypothetical protein